MDLMYKLAEVREANIVVTRKRIEYKSINVFNKDEGDKFVWIDTQNVIISNCFRTSTKRS